jgi:hypothetical protein
MEPIQRIMIRAQVFWQTLTANRSLKDPAQRLAVDYATVHAKPDDPTRKLVHHDQNPMRFQGCGFAAEQIAAPQTVLCVAQKAEPGWTLRA